MSTVADLDKLAEQTVDDLRATYCRVWQSACEHDGVSSDEVFVILSPDNPFQPYLDTVWQKYQQAMNDQQAFGYVGLDLNTKGVPKRKRKR